MRSHLNATPLLVVLLALVPVVGCDSGASDEPQTPPLLPTKTVRKKGRGPATPEQDAILRVLDADREQFKGGFGDLKPRSQPSAVAKMVGAYLAHLEKADRSGAPAEFQAAHDRHVKAWRSFHTAVGRLPDAYDGTEFLDALSALFNNKEGRGRSLGGDIINSVAKVNTTYAEVYTVSSGYGLEVSSE